MSRSLSVLAVRAHPKHSFAFSRYSLAVDTTQVPIASLCNPKYCQVPSRSPALNPGRLAAPQLMVPSANDAACRWPRRSRLTADGHALHTFTNWLMLEDGPLPAVYNKQADWRSWVPTQNFFKEIFA